MTHLGDICKINGAEIEPVDVITGGSPCQDLSVAGKRAGLQGERSGLFMEQIRIIKEMRDADKLRHTNAVSTDCGKGGATTIEGRIAQHGFCGANQPIRPRFMVWENVPGAFSSNKGEDFRIVLEETAKIADETAAIPRPDKGEWTTSGAIMGDGWSIAWRVFDAQFWGVPQRRRRIALVADFGGQSAPEILFKSDSVSGHFAESGTEREGVTADAERGVGTTSGSLTPFLPQTARIYDADGKWPTLQANSNGGQNRQAVFYPDVARSLTARHDSSPCIDRGQNIVAFTQNQRDEVRDLGDKAGALAAEPGMKQQTYVAGFCQGASPAAQTIGYQEEVSPTIKGAPSGTAQVPVVFSFDSLSSNSMKSSNPHSGCRQVEIAKCIDTTNPDPSKNQGGMAVVHGLVSKGNGESFLMPEKHMSLSTGGGQAGQGYPAIYDARGNGGGSIAPTKTGDHQNSVTDYTGVVTYAYQRTDELKESQVASTQSARQYKSPTDLVAAVDCRNGTENPDINGTLQAKSTGGMSLNLQNTVRQYQTVRRLTPLEAERLQGFPDNWTNIPPQAEVTAEDLVFWRKVWDEWDDMQGVKHHSDKQIIKWLRSEPADSARYKALGNSIALPPWRFVLSRIRQTGSKTLGSLFDGIGGFPLIWQELGGQAVWASEIEPFPIAVTKARIG